MNDRHLLSGTLTPPQVPADHLRRPRLDGVLRQDFRTLVLAANPGYGKTTLLASAAASSATPWLWCTCDARLSDPGRFVAHLAAAAGVDQASGTLEAHLDALYEAIPRGATISLDDAHELPDDALGIVRLLIKTLPGDVRIVVSGRTVPRLPIARLRLEGLVEIGEDELAFTVEETERVVAAATGLAREEARAIHRATLGWPAAVAIFATAGGDRFDRAAADLAMSEYVEEQLLDGLCDGARELLGAACELSWVNDLVIPALAGEADDPLEPLATLVARRLVRCDLEGGEVRYRVHPLVREVVSRRTAIASPGRADAVRARACEALLAAGRPGDAVAIIGAAPAAPEGRHVQDPPRPPERNEHRTTARHPLSISGYEGLGVVVGGRPVSPQQFRRRKARVLLAALVCAGGAVHRERLLEWLWPDLDTRRGLAALHSTLYALRRTIEPDAPRGESRIAVHGEAYELTLRDDDEFDVARYQAVAASALAAPEDRCSVDAMLAVARMPGGEVLPEWPYAEWTTAIRAEDARLRAAVMERCARLLIAAGRVTEAVEHLQRLVAMDPLREEPHRLLMEALANRGETGLALRQYEDCRRLLRDELGLAPSAETRAVHRRIVSASPGLSA